MAPKARRRQFSAAYKLRIIEAADACSGHGEVGALLRREGLYSSHLSTWRNQHSVGALSGLSPKKRGRKAKPIHPAEKEAQRLRTEVKRLELRLKQAETIIEVQKKLATLLGIELDEDGRAV